MAAQRQPLPLKKRTKAEWVEKHPVHVPEASKEALRQAMELEHVPAAQFQDLLWIMTQESGGRVDIKNRYSTARGLFQLLQANYKLNPNGIQSFGIAVEECQGGIRYVIGRYRTAGAARQFWQQHHWY